jgi:hypothetical protein
MQTRSQTASQELTVDIDFDEASKAWRENKIKLKNGCYKYKKAKNIFRRGHNNKNNKNNNNNNNNE